MTLDRSCHIIYMSKNINNSRIRYFEITLKSRFLSLYTKMSTFGHKARYFEIAFKISFWRISSKISTFRRKKRFLRSSRKSPYFYTYFRKFRESVGFLDHFEKYFFVHNTVNINISRKSKFFWDHFGTCC